MTKLQTPITHQQAHQNKHYAGAVVNKDNPKSFSLSWHRGVCIYSLTGSSFINALRRFINRRGVVRQLRSDQETTFIGARTKLRQALAEMDQSQVQDYLLQNGCDWIPFKMNVPHASHVGGVWERQIQTIRQALEPLVQTVGSQLDDKAFQTFLTEVEAIINARWYFLRQEPSSARTSILASGGGKYSKQPTSCGLGGEESTSKSCRAARSGSTNIETSK
eukprot:XP_011671372.1 PREDICTED: uncharacterized protein LOC105441693 [Strongylocentrotus purpuratus]